MIVETPLQEDRVKQLSAVSIDDAIDRMNNWYKIIACQLCDEVAILLSLLFL